MERLFGFLCEHWAGAGAILAVFLDISPVKINPVKWLLSRIGDLMFGRRFDELTKTVDENEMDRIRSTVLCFAASCREGTEHTPDEFRHIIDLNDKYEKLLEKYNSKNGVFSEEYQFVLRKYRGEE